MEPSYKEITGINPRLLKKSEKEVDDLFGMIISKGYIWNDEKKYFYNKDLEMQIRTQGLDVFTPESFERKYNKWTKDGDWEKRKPGLKYSKYIKFLFILFLIYLILGWIFIPLKIWLIILFILLGVIFIIRYIARKKMEK